MEGIHQLVNRSSSNKELSHDEVALLVSQSRDKNQEVGIAACFVYRLGHFLQI